MRPQTKRCHLKTCRPVWTCRVCGRKCCEHRCSLKTNDKTAICQKCKR